MATAPERRFLTPAETAERRRTTVGQLAQERYRGEGPPYVKSGVKVLYPLDLLREWEDARLITPRAATGVRAGR